MTVLLSQVKNLKIWRASDTVPRDHSVPSNIKRFKPDGNSYGMPIGPGPHQQGKILAEELT